MKEILEGLAGSFDEAGLMTCNDTGEFAINGRLHICGGDGTALRMLVDLGNDHGLDQFGEFTNAINRTIFALQHAAYFRTEMPVGEDWEVAHDVMKLLIKHGVEFHRATHVLEQARWWLFTVNNFNELSGGIWASSVQKRPSNPLTESIKLKLAQGLLAQIDENPAPDELKHVEQALRAMLEADVDRMETGVDVGSPMGVMGLEIFLDEDGEIVATGPITAGDLPENMQDIVLEAMKRSGIFADDEETAVDESDAEKLAAEFLAELELSSGGYDLSDAIDPAASQHRRGEDEEE